MTTVPFLDLGAAERELATELESALVRVARSGWYLLGEELAAFEREFAAYVGARHAVGVGSGLDALTFALKARGIGPGDEVIVPGHTFIATWLGVSHAGALPVPVDIDLERYTLDPGGIERALTPRTRAIVGVHLYGQPAEIHAITEIARARDLYVLWDAAQAHGARYRGAPIGAHGDSAWSFYPGKNLGAMGDAGAFTTDDPDVATRVRLLRNYGSSVKYVHETIGFNSRIDELQAAVLRVKLAKLDEWNERRRRIARRYLDGLRDTGLALPSVARDVDPVWHLFVVRSPDRDRLQERLRTAGVATLVHYPTTPNRQNAYAGLPIEHSLARSERAARDVLSLPMGPHLTDDAVDHVIAEVRRACS